MADDSDAVASTAVSAGQGAMAGAALGPWGMAAGAGLGVASSLVGGFMGSNAAKKAAEAQQAAAERWKAYVKSQQDSAISMVLTPSAMATHDQALQSQERNVKRMETLASTIDPNLIEAGKQTAALLQGHSAPVLANIQNQRAQQRQQMLDNLRTQLGPGAETSSAGMKAIQSFDLQTADVMNQAQQSYLDKVSNMSLNGGTNLGESLSRASSVLNSMNQDGPQQTAARLMASFTAAGSGAQQAGFESAGGQFKGQQLEGQMYQQLGSSILQGVGAYAGGKYNNKDTKTAATPAGNGTTAGGAPVPGGAAAAVPSDQMGMPAMKPVAASSYTPGGGAPAPGTLGSSISVYSGVGPYSPQYGGYGMGKQATPNYANVPNYAAGGNSAYAGGGY